MPIDLIRRLDRPVAQSQHHVFEALVLSVDHPERDRVAPLSAIRTFASTTSAFVTVYEKDSA